LITLTVLASDFAGLLKPLPVGGTKIGILANTLFVEFCRRNPRHMIDIKHNGSLRIERLEDVIAENRNDVDYDRRRELVRHKVMPIIAKYVEGRFPNAGIKTHRKKYYALQFAVGWRLLLICTWINNLVL
jgi:hypothetical protein